MQQRIDTYTCNPSQTQLLVPIGVYSLGHSAHAMLPKRGRRGRIRPVRARVARKRERTGDSPMRSRWTVQASCGMASCRIAAEAAGQSCSAWAACVCVQCVRGGTPTSRRPSNSIGKTGMSLLPRGGCPMT